MDGCINNKFNRKINQKTYRKVGVAPNVIGLLWNDLDRQIDLLIEASEDDEPYDGYQMLSKESQEAFDKGGLVFFRLTFIRCSVIISL